MRVNRTLGPCLAVAVAAVLCLRGSAAAEEYRVDTAHASVVFSISHNGLSYIYGMFRDFEGAYVLDDSDPNANRFRFSINVDSIDTNNGGRDNHLKNADFFNANQFPTITYESTGCSIEESQQGPVYVIDGNLTMHGVTKPLQMRLTLLGRRPGRGGMVSGFYGRLVVKRSEFGMTGSLDSLGDDVAVNVSFEGNEVTGGRGRRGR